MKRQEITNQKGEIEFRRKLVQHQIGGENFFGDEEHDPETGKIVLKERMDVTLARMTQLRATGIPLSPYIEIGAERGQRSLVMENDMQASGAALDISFDMLRTCEHYQKLFNQAKVPARLCIDANNLPFKSDSIPFVFCYEFLHHFPDPGPIVAEIYRVLQPGGYFAFEEEPYKKVMHWDLYDGEKSNSQSKKKRNIVLKVCDRFLARNTCNEVLHNVIENDRISIGQWKNALKVFKNKQARLRPTPRFSFGSELFNPPSQMKYLASYLLGGSISGLCRKDPGEASGLTSIEAALICPSCKEQGNEEPLSQSQSIFTCTKCSKKYPVVDGVAFLFEYKRFMELYPEVFKAI